MRMLRTCRDRLRALLRRDAVAGEIHDELQFHLQARIAEHERRGLSPEAARQEALKRFGSPALVQDLGYDVRGGGVADAVGQDVRYALRLFRRQPGFALGAALILAIGIGLSTAVFSIIDAALLRPLPFDRPQQLVSARLMLDPDGDEASAASPSLVEIASWRETSRSIQAVGLMRHLSTMVADSGGGPERVTLGELADGAVGVFGVAPVLGRDFAPDDLRKGGPMVVLLGYGYWQRRFGADPAAVGRVVRFADGPATIVGVLPAHFYRHTAVWRPYKAPPDWRVSGSETIARLRANVSVEQAARELTGLSRRLATGRGDRVPARVELTTVHAAATSGYGVAVASLSGAVGFLLSIACVNVSGLLLARGAARRPELAIRASIGATGMTGQNR